MSFVLTNLRLRLSAQQQWIARSSRAKKVLISFAVDCRNVCCFGYVRFAALPGL
jgi:hypothetical protein